MANKPNIRFKGFTDDWEQRKLGECAIFNPKSELPDIFEYVDLESVVGTNILCHRTENKSSAPLRAQRLAQKKDVFYQTVRPYQMNNCIFENDEDNWVFSTGYAQLRPYNDSYFLLTLLQNDDFVKQVLDRCTGTSYPAINSNDLADIDVSIPLNENEQKKIGGHFRNLDHLITLHQRKCDETKKLKKFMLQKMFPKNGEKNPEIRFAGFTDDWEQRKLGEIIDAYNEKKPKNIDLPVLTSSRQGIQKQEEHFGSEQKHDTKDYNVIPMGYCTYRNRSDDKTFTFNINHSVKRGIVSKFYPVFSINNGNAKFITEFLNTNLEIKNRLAVLAVGTSQVVLSFANLKELKLCVPSKLEQDKIGNYIDTLDHLITLHQRKCDKLKLIKKFMLQNMFPKKG